MANAEAENDVEKTKLRVKYLLEIKSLDSLILRYGKALTCNRKWTILRATSICISLNNMLWIQNIRYYRLSC